MISFVYVKRSLGFVRHKENVLCFAIKTKVRHLFEIEISFFFSKTEAANMPYLRRFLVCDTSSSARYSPYSPLMDIGLSNFSPFCSIFGYSHPAPASRPAQIVTPPSLRASYTTYTKTRFWSRYRVSVVKCDLVVLLALIYIMERTP
jgi:hypothetical protein